MPSRLAPSRPSQARRRQLIAGAVVLLAIALVFLLLRPGSGPSHEEPDATQDTSTTDSDLTPPPAATPTSTKPTLPDYTTTGTYQRMPVKSGVRGTEGRLVTYRVEVENGSGVRSREFAWAIDRTLSHPRGWTAGGEHRFQRVADDRPELTIRLATPKTVDKKCAAAGADTEGYTSCRAGGVIYLNLDRWYIGVPHVDDLHLYRQYLINHEVGHGLGRGHESCPGQGWYAPVMLQQTLDLDGCQPNAWPVDEDGEELRGPATP
ncbi:MAG TPA: DUF3152 domain-containing protein [Candidatus Janibacter merdipullorum]|nr:DUF3152 domain-containing protein [Candidatus Janibacter merdipullorum]